MSTLPILPSQQSLSEFTIFQWVPFCRLFIYLAISELIQTDGTDTPIRCYTGCDNHLLFPLPPLSSLVLPRSHLGQSVHRLSRLRILQPKLKRKISGNHETNVDPIPQDSMSCLELQNTLLSIIELMPLKRLIQSISYGKRSRKPFPKGNLLRKSITAGFLDDGLKKGKINLIFGKQIKYWN